MVLDRANHRAVVVLSNTAAQVYDAADNLLVGEQLSAGACSRIAATD
jgi:hypothetical protein